MAQIKRLSGLLAVLAAVVMALSLVSCGGGGSGGPQEGPTGGVAILLADGPVDGLTEVNVTITRVELIADDFKATVFTGEKTLDLLKLASTSALFSVSSGVPARKYEKIRLHVKSITLVKDSEVIYPKLPGGGKIDLNPRGGFYVKPGVTLALMIDMDVEKSIHVVKTGSKDKYIFRPVVFVKILKGVHGERLVRVSGVVKDLDGGAGLFKVCPAGTFYQSAWSSLDTHVDATKYNRPGCVPVRLLSGTSIFDAGGEPAGPGSLADGMGVTVVGHARVDYHDYDDGYVHFAVDAAVVEIGDFLHLDGTIATGIDTSTRRFDFSVKAGQGFTDPTVLPSRLQSGARVFSRNGVELPDTEITANRTATLDGVLSIIGTNVDVFKTALVVLDTALPHEKKEGVITLLDRANRGFYLVQPYPLPVICVSVPEDAVILLIESTGTTHVSTETTIQGLSNGQEVELYGGYGTSSCFEARVVLASPGGP